MTIYDKFRNSSLTDYPEIIKAGWGKPKMKVEESKVLPDGKHEGKITDVEVVERGENKYEYRDITIKEKETGFDVNHSVPNNLMEKSKLGILLSAFKDFKEGDDVKVKDTLMDQEIEFQTTTNKAGFSDVINESVKPLKK